MLLQRHQTISSLREEKMTLMKIKLKERNERDKKIKDRKEKDSIEK